MRSMIFVVFAVLCLNSMATSSQAATVFTATLTGAGENPPNASPGIGTGVFTLSTSETMLTVDLSFSGLTAPASAAHIHCCAGPGTNAAVVLNFVGTGFPTGVTAGTYDHTFTLATDLIGITPAAFLSALFAGTTYANIHNANFPGGEIRGQLITTVPEPGSLLLLVGGVLVLAGGRRFQAKRSSPLKH